MIIEYINYFHILAGLLLLFGIILRGMQKPQAWKVSAGEMRVSFNGSGYIHELGSYLLMFTIFGLGGWLITTLILLFLSVLILNPSNAGDLPSLLETLIYFGPLYILTVYITVKSTIVSKKEKNITRQLLNKRLNDHTSWEHLKRRFKNEDIDSFRNSAEAAIKNALKIPFVSTGRLKAVWDHISDNLNNPNVYFSLHKENVSNDIDKLLNAEGWIKLKSRYDAAMIDETLKKFKDEWDVLRPDLKNRTSEAGLLLSSIEKTLNNPGGYLDYPLEESIRQIRKFLQKDSMWDQWKNLYNYDLTDSMRRSLQQSLQDIENQKDLSSARNNATILVRNKIRPLVKDPSRFLQVNDETTSSDQISNSLSGSFFSDDSSDELTSDSGNSESDTGGGGSFGGAGASDSW